MRHLGIAVVLTVLAGCGGEEIRRYRVVVDPAPLSALPGSCYRGGTPPSQRVEDRNLFRDFQWTVWEAGSGDRAYLELSDPPEGGWRLGDAPPVMLSGAIVGDGESFAAERVVATTDGQVLESTAMRVHFEDRDTISKGVVELASRCASCAGGSALACEARLAFTAREEVLQE